MDDYGDIPGARDVRNVLETDPLARIAGARIERPEVVGALIFLLVLLMIVLGPATDSRFIYTDF